MECENINVPIVGGVELSNVIFVKSLYPNALLPMLVMLLGIVNAVSTTIESYIRSVPPIRREKNSVRQYLLDLADDCIV